MKKILILAVLLLTGVCLAGASVSAQTATSNGVITKGFQVKGSVQDIAAGALVSFSDSDSRDVVLTDTGSADRLVGIVDKNPLIAISGGDQEIPVVLSGTVNTLVSDINGDIRAGDKIAPSPVAGVGMLATSDGQVVGTALADFNTGSAQTRTVTDTKGQSHTIHVGYVPLQAGIAYYQAPGSSVLPPFVQNLANSIAGRQVSLIRILVSSVLVLVSFIGMSVLIYGSIRSALTSVGRNPLAAGAIRKSLYQVGIVVVVVAAGTLLAGYLILTI